MKKLALVLGSLLVVGSVASAKEVMPAPTPAPEVIVRVVEKPVVVYRDRLVQDTKWRPSGAVSVDAKTYHYAENAFKNDANKNWKNPEDVHTTKLTTKANINLTEKQNFSVKVEDLYGLDTNHRGTKNKKVVLGHTYDFGKIADTKIGAAMTSEFTRKGAKKELALKPVFDFTDYFFANDYVKATALELAPVYTYTWERSNYTNEYALYANAAFELPYGVTFQAEFDKFFAYGKAKKVKNEENKAYKVGKTELTLAKSFDLYKEGKHEITGELKGTYETFWAWSSGDKSVKEGPDGNGTVRSNGDKEKWGAYTAKFEPSATYSYAATEYVKLHTTLGAEYKNSNSKRHSANYWRWQPYAEVGFKATF